MRRPGWHSWRGPLLALAFLAAPTLSADQVTPSDRVVHWVNVRASTSVSSGVIGRLRPGELAQLLETLPRWYRVELTDTTQGFLSRSWTILVSDASHGFAVHFIDVGTGDSTLIDLGEHEILIDGGNYADDVRAYLAQRDLIQGPLELLIITHADTDHWKGLVRLLGFDGSNPSPVEVLEVWEPGYDRDCKPANDGGTVSYRAFIANIAALGDVRLRRPLEEEHPPATTSGNLDPLSLTDLPGVRLTVLYTDATPEAVNGECSYLINNASIVLRVDIGTHRILFTGDANGKERNESSPGTPGHTEAVLLALEADHPGTLRADILKVPHHGSETASTQAFIDAVDPRFAVVSASTTHHLPRATVIQRYTHPGRTILRTDRNHAKNTDHIVCAPASGGLTCDYAPPH